MGRRISDNATSPTIITTGDALTSIGALADFLEQARERGYGNTFEANTQHTP